MSVSRPSLINPLPQRSLAHAVEPSLGTERWTHIQHLLTEAVTSTLPTGQMGASAAANVQAGTCFAALRKQIADLPDQLPTQLGTSADPPLSGKPPLYTPDGLGGWREHWNEYDADTALAWCVAEWQRAADDPLYFATHYCYALNLHDEKTMEGEYAAPELFPDWPHVRALFAALFPPRDVVIEKSRRMMATWVVMATLLHDLIFRRNWPMMAMSYREDEVDNGGENNTIRSMFGKLRYLWEGLPAFFRIHPLDIRSFIVVNRAANNELNGYSVRLPGRGGGFKRAICDEFAHVEHSEAAMASIALACAVGKALISTAYGRSNAFYRIRESAYQAFPKLEPQRYPRQFARYTIHWSLHPSRDEAWKQSWIDSQAMTQEAIAEQIEINYNKSIGRRVYPTFDFHRHVVGGLRCPVETVEYDPSRPLYLTCDFNHDPLIWMVVQTHARHPRFRVIGEICMRSASTDDAILEFIFRYASDGQRQTLLEHEPGWGDQYGLIFRGLAGANGHALQVVLTGDATEEKSTHHDKTRTYSKIVNRLRDDGRFQVLRRIPTINPPIQLRIETVNDALLKGEVVLHGSCEQLRKDFEEGAWNKQQTDMTQSDDDDDSGLSRSHASSALGYLLCQLHKVGTSVSAIGRKRERPSLREMLPQVGTWNG